MEYVVGFVAGLVVGYVLAKLIDGKFGGVSELTWTNPLSFYVSGGLLQKASGGAPFRPVGEPLASGDKVKTSENEFALIFSGGKECTLTLSRKGEIAVLDETEVGSSPVVHYSSLTLNYGALSYIGLISATMRIMGPGRRFIVRTKGHAIGPRGSGFTVVAPEGGTTATLTVLEKDADVIGGAGGPAIPVPVPAGHCIELTQNVNPTLGDVKPI